MFIYYIHIHIYTLIKISYFLSDLSNLKSMNQLDVRYWVYGLSFREFSKEIFYKMFQNLVE